MRLSVLLVLILVSASASAEDLLETSRPSPVERRKREEATKLWMKTADVRDALALNQRGRRQIKDGKPKVEMPPPARLREALAQIEDVVQKLERSLGKEWNGAANEQLAQAVKVWFKLREIVPAEAEPTDPDAAKKARKQKETARRQRLRGARRFVLDYYKARKYSSLFHQCRKCDGRGEHRSPFGGDSRTCPTCGGAGKYLNRKNVLRCSWLAHSPLYRARGRNESRVNRLANTAASRPAKLGPFVSTVTVKGQPEDHNVWVRLKLESRKSAEPGKRGGKKEIETVVVYRVGAVWYLYDKRHDGKVLKIEDEEEAGS